MKNKFDLFEFRNYKEKPISFEVDILDKITSGGLHDSSLNYVFLNTGAKKNLFQCHVAASAMRQNKNVLFITNELSQERIYEMIQANLLNDTILNLHDKEKSFYDSLNLQTIETLGKLTVIDNYCNYSSFAEFMSQYEQRIEYGSVPPFGTPEPDIILIDVISHPNDLENDSMYLRTCLDHKIPILISESITLKQLNSIGLKQIKIHGMSFGIEITDKTKSSYTITQVKNRYTSPDENSIFTIGVDYGKMKLYNAEQSKLEL